MLLFTSTANDLGLIIPTTPSKDVIATIVESVSTGRYAEPVAPGEDEAILELADEVEEYPTPPAKAEEAKEAEPAKEEVKEPAPAPEKKPKATTGKSSGKKPKKTTKTTKKKTK